MIDICRPFVEARASHHNLNMFNEIGEKLYIFYDNEQLSFKTIES